MTKLTEENKNRIREHLLTQRFSQRAIARMFGVSKSTIQRVSAAMNGHAPSSRSYNYIKNQQIERGVVEIVKKLRESDVVVNGPMLQSIALKLSRKMGIDNFSASNGF